MLEVSSSVQLAPGATLVQLLASTATSGTAVLSTTVMSVAVAVPLLVTSSTSGVPLTAMTRLGCTGPVMAMAGKGTTVRLAVTVFELSPLIATAVGPSGAMAVRVKVHDAPIANTPPQVVLCTDRPLPLGMTAATFCAATGDPAALVTVTLALPFMAKVRAVGATLMIATGAGITCTLTVAVSVLLPLMVTAAGPAGAAAVKVMVHAAPGASAAPQVVPCTVMALPPGMCAATFCATTGDEAALATVTLALPPAMKPMAAGATLMLATACAASALQMASTLTWQVAPAARGCPAAQSAGLPLAGGGSTGATPPGKQAVKPGGAMAAMCRPRPLAFSK